MRVVAAAFGVAVGGAGWLAALAAAVARSERVEERLGPPQRSSGRIARLNPPGWLEARAAAGSWPGRAWSYAGTLLGSAVIGTLLGFDLAGPVGGLAGLAGGPAVVQGVLARRTAVVRVRAEEHLREAILALAAGVRGGLSVRRAVEEASRDAGPPLHHALRRVGERLAVGERLEASLEDLAARLDLPDVRLVGTVLAVHARTGGDLPVMLEEVADVIGDRVRSRREIRALTAQGRASGAVLAVLPVAFVALLSGTGGEALGAFYRSPSGAAFLLAGLVCDLLGFLWIRRIVLRAEAGS
jgi:Flp pilus assembly protein TadB